MQENENPLSSMTGVHRIEMGVNGRVQGVGYRSYVTGCAAQCGVSGYVRNLPDGTVEIVAEGEAADLAAFLDEIEAQGEPVISVEGITICLTKPTGEFAGFEARFGDRKEELFKRSMLALDLMKEVLKTEENLLAEQKKTNKLLEEILKTRQH